MKKLKEIPAEVTAGIKSAHEEALDKLSSGVITYCVLPVRIVRMRISRTQTERESTLESVVVPETVIRVTKGALLDKDTLNRDAIRYSIANTNYPFPFGHIYKDSGHVCLGNIFVPSRISKYTPALPLETLFLHNDRNINHGYANLSLSKDVVEGILDILDKYHIKLPKSVQKYFRPDTNLIENDGLWIVSAEVVQQCVEVRKAISIMTEIYQTIFEPEPEEIGELNTK